MPTKKSSKRKVQSAKRKVQNTERNGQNADRKLSYSQLEAQIEEMQEQIALLQAQSAESKAQRADTNAKRKDQSKGANQNHSALCALRSALPKIGPNPLPAPVLVVTSVGANEIVVSWNAVSNASGYTIELADNPAFSSVSL